MVVDERGRHRLFRRLEEVLGPDEAGTLMEHLPPVGWADVARKSDIEALHREMVHLEERLSDRFDAKLESKLNSQTRTLVTLMSAQVVAVAGLAFAAARLA
jgi:hypothetical protein